MPAEPKKKKSQHPRIYCGRLPLNVAIASGKISDSDRGALAANTVRTLSDDYELFPTDRVKSILDGLSVPWRENLKDKPKPAEQQQQKVS